jgi:hypothetical protein
LEANILTLGFNEKVYAQSAPSNGQISIFSDATHAYGTNNLFWDNANNKLDITGTINSSGGLCINNDCKSAWSQVTSTSTNYWALSSSSLYPTSTTYNLGVGTASLDSNYKITTSGGGIKAESTSQPAGYFNSTSGYGLIVNNGNVGIGTTAPGEKLDVNGNVRASAFLYSSDRNLKTDISNIENALNKIISLQGVNFKWKDSGKASLGLIAQDVEKVFPELVTTDKNTGLKSLEYGNLTAALIEAVKQQQTEIKNQQTEIENLKTEIDKLKSIK